MCISICLDFCLGQCFDTGPDRFGRSPFVQAHPGRFPPRPKNCTKQPWCRSPPSGWSTIYLYMCIYIYICLDFCLGQCFHTGPDRFGRSPSVQAHPGRFPSKHKPSTQKKTKTNNSSGEPPKSHHASPLHAHTHTSCRAFPALGPTRTPPKLQSI